MESDSEFRITFSFSVSALHLNSIEALCVLSHLSLSLFRVHKNQNRVKITKEQKKKGVIFKVNYSMNCVVVDALNFLFVFMPKPELSAGNDLRAICMSCCFCFCFFSLFLSWIFFMLQKFYCAVI